jgi:hypothetical protein
MLAGFFRSTSVMPYPLYQAGKGIVVNDSGDVARQQNVDVEAALLCGERHGRNRRDQRRMSLQ